MRLDDRDFIRKINLIPKGEHPRRDVYTKKNVAEIAVILRITDPIQIRKLRRKLVEAALMILKWRQLHGSAKSNRSFHDWLRLDLAKQAAALRKVLDNPPLGDALPLHSRIKWDSFEGFHRSLNDFIKRIDFLVHQPKDEKKNSSRHLTKYKEIIVGLLTGIYGAEFLCRRPTRKVDNESVYGEFVDFVRAAGRPLLMLEINEHDKSFKRHIKFDRQIQDALKPIDPKEYEPFLRK